MKRTSLLFSLMIAVAFTLLTGCAAMNKAFTEPVYASAEAEQEACLKSALCRALIDDRPAWVYRYSSQRELCTAHAQEIADQARADGRIAGFAIGDMGPIRHAVALVDDGNGNLWAFDNGTISPAPFPASELTHHMSRIWWVNELPPETKT